MAHFILRTALNRLMHVLQAINHLNVLHEINYVLAISEKKCEYQLSLFWQWLASMLWKRWVQRIFRLGVGKILSKGCHYLLQ